VVQFPNKAESQDAGPPPKKTIQAVVSGATQKPRPPSKRLFGAIFAESPRNLGSQVGREVVLPRMKMALEEAVMGLVRGMLWGNERPVDNLLVQRAMQRSNMRDYSGISTSQTAIPQTPTRSSGNYEDLILPDMRSAERLLAYLAELINEYRCVAVGDLYEAAGITGMPSDNAFGWTSLTGARISATRGGFLLELPRPTLL
jgi:hypothetical protein